MFSFKQIEALYWIAQLGGFAAAANKLNTTQSAISKRIRELESVIDAPMFERNRRQARLSEKGEEMLLVARRMLEQRDAAMEQLSQPEAIVRRVRVGVTELTAMTWLPRLVQRVHRQYPKVVIEAEVDLSVNLRDKMLADEIDLVIVPDVFDEPQLSIKLVGTVENAWMARPGLLPTGRVLGMNELAAHTILTQGGLSGTGLICQRWFKSISVTPGNAITSNSLVALIGLTASGMGVSYLPRRCMASLIDRGVLEVIETSPELPEVNYVALYRAERKSVLIASTVQLAQESCDFSQLFQTEAEEGQPDSQARSNADLFR
jgi:DNA-binding transcriptional LysR family regulator